MSNGKLKFPAWQQPLQELILESDREKFFERVKEVEQLISERRQQLWKDGGGIIERGALDDATRILRNIQRNSVGFADAK